MTAAQTMADGEGLARTATKRDARGQHFLTHPLHNTLMTC